MRHYLPARRCCPQCGGPVSRVNREIDGTDIAPYLLPADVPFLLLFGACVLAGMFDLLAGIVAASCLGLLYFACARSRAVYRCEPCGTTFRRSTLARARPGSD